LKGAAGEGHLDGVVTVGLAALGARDSHLGPGDGGSERGDLGLHMLVFT